MKKDTLIPEEFFKMGDNFNAFIPDMEKALKESRRKKQEERNKSFLLKNKK